ncbi:hypothetical protein CEXT_129241 [Caerostris extrusa]|uniref:Uncharacterized protein n=1 Tax=Caerostris extrusa TaxID=172846 RepID=A0AAV4UI17_CAEEX|nr:hypothetical protein CEXT_129241 [Caerostris extrusa]
MTSFLARVSLEREFTLKDQCSPGTIGLAEARETDFMAVIVTLAIIQDAGTMRCLLVLNCDLQRAPRIRKMVRVATAADAAEEKKK